MLPPILVSRAAWASVTSSSRSSAAGRRGPGLSGPRRPGALCAIKTLVAPDAGEAPAADELRRLVDEARLATRLHHANLIYVSEVELGARPPFLVMEYVRGKSLRQVLDRCAEWELAFRWGWPSS
jgi:serine/threonine protein kinase